MDQLVDDIIRTSLKTGSKVKAIELLKRNGKITLSDISSVVYDVVSSPEAEKEAEEAESIEDWKNVFLYSGGAIASEFPEKEQNEIAECILREQIARYDKPDEYLETWYKYIRGEVY